MDVVFYFLNEKHPIIINKKIDFFYDNILYINKNR